MCNIRKAELQENKHKFHAKKQKPKAKQTFVKRAIAILVCKAENSKRNRYGKILPDQSRMDNGPIYQFL